MTPAMRYYLADDGEILKDSGQTCEHTGMYFDST
jgi:hypothetical protein